MVIAVSIDPASLNELLIEGQTTATIVPLIYSYLLTIDGNGKLVPDVATEVPTLANKGISPDGLTITYHLRKDVKWQDGVPLTARDIVFSYDAVMNPRNNVPSRDGYGEIRRLQAVDDYTVRVTLKRPYAPILSWFLAPNQNYGILPAHLLARYPDINHVPYNAKPVGSGPYRVAEWVRGDHVRLVRNTSYYAGRPAIPEITLKFIADSNTTLNQLRTGEVNAYFNADSAFLREYGQISWLDVRRVRIGGMGTLMFNVTDPAVSDVRVRKAIAQSLNLPEIVRNATRGAQNTVQANRGLFSWGFDPSVPQTAYDPANAKRLLKTVGAPRSLTFATLAGNSVDASVGVQLQQALRPLGITLVMRSFTPALFYAPAADGGPIFGGKFQIAFTEILTPADPDTQWYLGCAQAAPNGFNLSRFCDPATDRAEAAGVANYDPAVRRKYASIVQRRVALLVPYVPFWQTNETFIVPKSLRGFQPSPESALWNAGRWSF
jgi:peptide/nickel transport system substrate-binding protein